MDMQQDTKTVNEDFPFEDEGLFSNTSDAVLQNLDKSIKALRTLAVT